MTENKLCAKCGGKLIDKVMTIDQHWGDELIIFEDVPAEVCIDCGEVWLSAETSEKMERVIKEKKPAKTKEIPVWSLVS